MRVLIAEDEHQKLANLRSFVAEICPRSEVAVARSVTSALDEIEDGRPDVVLLDMSLPTFDIDSDEPGGRPQGFGGTEVLRFMSYMGLKSDVIVVTAYEGFEDDRRSVDLSSLERELAKEHPEVFKGIVHYGGMSSEWRSELREVLRIAGHLEG